MRNPFSSSPAQQPFLSPLGRRRRLPSVAVPAILTLCGGAALVVACGALFGGMLFGPGSAPSSAASVEAAPLPVEESVETAAAGETQVEEEPALLTAMPQPASADSGEVVLEPIAPAAAPATQEPGEGDAALSALAAGEDRTGAIPSLPAEITSFAPQPRPATQTAVAASDEGDKQAAVARRAVNMRAAPNGRAQVLGVVPAAAEIRAETGCSWCEISYQGRTGFVYKSFIDYR